jgi:ribosome-binding protein aMBF1 (putative translation factor)
MRLAKSWSQHHLANEVGTRQALISSLEAGDAKSHAGVARQDCGALGVRLPEK